MAYGLKLTGDNMEEDQKLLTEKIEGYWTDVPQDMWSGFKGGWNDYFGEDGAGLGQLFEDAWHGALGWINDVLGIHSPSTVMYDIGDNCVQGLNNGWKYKWDIFVSNIKTWWGSLESWWNGLSLKTITGGVTINSRGYSSVSGKFATGGFPEDGLFYANHNELVGRFDNGRTAVANNEQIIAGIERGVSNARKNRLGRNKTQRTLKKK